MPEHWWDTAVHRFRNWHLVEQRIVPASCLPDQKRHWASFIDAGVGIPDVPTRTRTEFVDCETDQTDNDLARYEKGEKKQRWKTTAWICFKWPAALTIMADHFMGDICTPDFIRFLCFPEGDPIKIICKLSCSRSNSFFLTRNSKTRETDEIFWD